MAIMKRPSEPGDSSCRISAPLLDTKPSVMKRTREAGLSGEI